MLASHTTSPCRFPGRVLGPLIVLTALVPSVAQADPPAAVSTAPAATAPPAVVPLVVVKPDPRDPVNDQHFSVDPVADGVIIAAGGGTAGLLELILSTGEIVPQKPGSPSNLLSFDQTAVSQTVDPHAALLSNIGLGAAVGFAAIDTVLSGLRDGWDASLVDGMMYAESITLTLALDDITKLAVRRPRPLAYTEQAQLNAQCAATTPPTPAYACPTISSTDTQLSFFSGHAAVIAATTATATYLAFVRAPHSPRPWITLAAGVLLTGFVSVERVRAGAHFPTDVIAGSLFGGAVGVLVPHFHRRKEESPGVWIGLAPAPGGGGTASLQRVF
jgi:undecaprenyl-diphosphatase